MVDYLKGGEIGYPGMPDALKAQFESGKPWDLEDGDILQDPAARQAVKDSLLGNIFTISTHLIEKDVVSVKDLELGICTSLACPRM